MLTEARDVGWGNETLRRANESLVGKAPKARIVESSCSSTVCRLVLAHASLDDQRELGVALAEAPPFDQGTFYRYDKRSNPPKSTLYVIRTGHDLAELTGAETAHLLP